MASPKGKAIVIMGPSGAGKSTIGQMLGKAINGRFVDADDFHSPSNKGNASNLGSLERKVVLESVKFSFKGKVFGNAYFS
ncbi:unnamed protein product [Cuscuta campestris]|uniref:gluconokinase n=1 Tax=Cuscuta campestris TaxID=132261 RepID=A0A484JYZ1_9ASTE|nr:unnamed protein product [Cuscuta campestris]